MKQTSNENNSKPSATALIYNKKIIQNSNSLITAFEQLMTTTIETMQVHDPEHAQQWTWGICEVSDICYEEPHFYYGSDDDKPKDFPEDQQVWVKVISPSSSKNDHLYLIR